MIKPPRSSPAGGPAPPGDKPPALAGCPRAAPFRGVDITGADYARQFRCPTTRQARARLDFSGQIVVVFFGYTQCP